MIRSQDTPADILIVDDTPANLDVLSTMLTRHGYKVRPALSGALALKAAQSVPPDLILLDILMPGMDGYMVCEQLKGMESTRDIPVIFISALDDVRDKVKAFQSGGVDYITKPFQLREVLARIENHLTLDRLHKQVHTLSSLKDQMVRTVSHDLVVPLDIVRHCVQSVRSSESLQGDETARSQLETAYTAVDQMHRLVTGLLDLAKIESGLSLNLRTLTLAELLSDPLQAYRVPAEQKQVTLQFLPPPPVSVAVDPERIAQVLNNLLSNAVKYTPSGGTITVSARHEKGQVVLTVQDSGIGIPTTDLPRIFDRFHRVEDDAHLEIQGTGLGLSIAKAIIEQHRGRIWAESEAGQGTQIRVSLPVT